MCYCCCVYCQNLQKVLIRSVDFSLACSLGLSFPLFSTKIRGRHKQFLALTSHPEIRCLWTWRARQEQCCSGDNVFINSAYLFHPFIRWSLGCSLARSVGSFTQSFIYSLIHLSSSSRIRARAFRVDCRQSRRQRAPHTGYEELGDDDAETESRNGSRISCPW